MKEKLIDIYYAFYRFFRDIPIIPDKIKYFFQRVFRGFSDDDIWSLDCHLAKLITKRLKAFQKMDKHGIPCPMRGLESTAIKDLSREWEKRLKKMIWAFDNYKKDDYCTTHYGEMKLSEPDSKTGRKTIIDFGCKTNEKKLKKHWDRTEEGMQLFIEHFGDLWD